MKLITLAALFAGAVLFIFPASAHAVSTLTWGDLVEDPETGGIFFDDPIDIQDDGTYAVPLNVSKDVQVETDDPFVFAAEGALFRIPDPEIGTREFVASIGGFFGSYTLAWEETGVYELDVYEVDPPSPNNVPWLQRVFAFIFGTAAHAQPPEDLIETIRFTILEEGAAEECCSSVLFLPGIMGSRLYEDGEKRWEPSGEEDVQALYLDAEGKSISADTTVTEVIDEIPVTGGNIYESFLTDLVTASSAGTIAGYAAVPYDWRLSMPDILADGELEETLRTLAASSQTGKVAIVAHSNGGFLARALINELGAEASE